MMSSRPYLVRAFNEWILDNQCTPYIVVDAGVQGVQVPTEHVANGQIVLNISPGAVRGLVVGNAALEFSARFGGVPMQVFIPLQAVMAIYAKENGEGMVFGSEPGTPDPDGPRESSSKSSSGSQQGERPSGRPTLKVVK
ncbi:MULTISPECIES: ClpXP protease specificity-enhancing factor [Marinobacter]|uniref:ClpXP protease specificity-enhancing factor n=1 Tax=Marinobacter xestospongiae TaxID=994319 RepID=A0ABU3VTP8_9GAMM|nr:MULTISPECIES: ClpXP protease specificity-enhancing factor [Marinobacter]MCG8518929.1 ClpXP protease specificity-enhancing factor [Pseudomonadales bacterium]MCK7567631.1 ClpXP protease specificity-enhancing factor [Marinobacter xestospongiae]MDV2077525.1 ClpXP protease specificity-enhancing factor [Marinobacter xestospongiae]UDL07422.1 ClpXP protease specificity-enhancing factor [Marinobacter sp. CA1]